MPWNKPIVKKILRRSVRTVAPSERSDSKFNDQNFSGSVNSPSCLYN